MILSVILHFVDRIESMSQNDGVFAWQPRMINARQFKRIDWDLESVLLVITSTAGDGKTVVVLHEA